MVFVNGDWVGTTCEPMAIWSTLRKRRRQGLIHPHTSIYIRDSHLFIMTDSGRALRPLIPIDETTDRPALTKEIVGELVRGEIQFEDLFLDSRGERDAVME